MIKTRYEGRTAVSVDFTGTKSRTKQAPAEEVDINRIMARYRKTGQLPLQSEARQAFYGDFSDGLDYMSVLLRLKNAEAAFASLPSQLRRRFENDPAMLLEFVQDPANVDEAVSLGLMVRREETPAPPPPPTGEGAAVGVTGETGKGEK